MRTMHLFAGAWGGCLQTSFLDTRQSAPSSGIPLCAAAAWHILGGPVGEMMT